MKSKIILAAILILLGYQAFSQQITIKGRLIDYETGDPIFTAGVISQISDNDGGFTNDSGAMTDNNGKFEFKGNPELIQINYIGYHSIIITNIPKQKKEIDFGEIKLVTNHITDHAVIGGPPSELYDYEKQKKQDDELKEVVDSEYIFEFYEQKLKPYFDGNTLIIDCAKIQED